ncbi:molybdopterin cofactor-binding domain-containing protein [Paraburkholderia sp. EG287B]|uniref:molybdopterin cofactor-binding domain-containing protein n=1 Tax=Paraburkholderia sp. EG287B TaxID=3237010 RepID=UPI0034D25709
MDQRIEFVEQARIAFELNGQAVTCDIDPRVTLGDFLRHQLGKTGTHYGCEHGVCGACTVLVDGRSMRSCLQLCGQVDGRKVTTVEGLANADGSLGILQQAFQDRHALQCGYCTPGMLTTLTEFLRANPDPSEAQVRDAISGNICRCTGYQAIVEAALLAAARMRGEPDPAFGPVTAHSKSSDAPSESAVGARYVGKPVKRTEDPALLKGEGQFVDDIQLAGTLHCCFVRSSHAHARIRHIDTQAAKAVPGVQHVWTFADLDEALRGPLPVLAPTHMLTEPRMWSPLAADEVCYVGEAVAVVLAESRYIAEDAANLVQIDYEVLPVAGDIRKIFDPDAPRAHSDVPTNLLLDMPFAFGEVDSAFASAAHVVKREIFHHRGTAHPMECRATLARLDGGTGDLTVWNSGQAPHLERRLLAQALRYDEAKIRVIMPDVGGAFGPKGIAYPEEFVVASAALRLGVPVKWTEDRREHFLCITQERDQLWDLEMALDQDGKILGVRGSVVHDNGAYVPWGIVVPIIAVTSSLGPYVVPAFDVKLKVACTNMVPTTPVRGAGRPKAVFAMERMLDAAADQLGLTRLEIRRRNFVQPEQLPYKTGLIFRDGSQMVYDSGDYPETQEKAVELAGLDAFRARQEHARAQQRYLGIGFANYVEGCGLGPYEGAEVTLQNDGRIHLDVGGAGAQGQGMKTIFAQIAADQLGVEMDAITVVVGDTGKLAMGVGTFASRITVNAGNAVHIACGKLAGKIRALAANALRVPLDQIEVARGVVGARGQPERALPLGKIAQMSYGIPGFTLPEGLDAGMTVTHYFSPKASVYANGTAFAEVEVDLGTGYVKVLRYGVAHDCGNVINPMLVEGQVIGAISHGIGNTLLERHAYDENAQPLATNFAEFLLPTALDMPSRIAMAHLVSPSPNNPLGAKGAGEGGTIPASAAIVSAIEDALSRWSIRFDETPVLPEMIFERLHAAGAYSDIALSHTSNEELAG